jgi:hypothetical protein
MKPASRTMWSRTCRSIMAVLAATTLAALPLQVAAQAKDKGAKDEAHRKSAIGDHRIMAKAHEDAAKCLESGKEEKACHAELAKACKDLGIGKYCGMKHRH